jgi:predicted dehydrogenase
MKVLKWGFIGCGEVTEKKSGPAFSEVEGSSVVAVMSRTELHARTYAVEHGIKKWYTDAQELIDDPDVNAVYVATPPASHATYAIMAMKAGKPVYVEKPLAASYEDCARINRISEQTGVPCFVAYYRRYLPYFQKVKDIVNSGRIGKIMNVQIRYTEPLRDADAEAIRNHQPLPWRLQPDIAGGGYFYDLAPHQLDLLQEMFGVIVEARGICANRGRLYSAEDSVSAVFRFENGLPGSGSWCFVGHESARTDRILLIGNQGSLSFSVFNYDPIEVHTSEGRQRIEVPNPQYVQYPLIKNVCEHLQGRAVCTATSVSATSVNWVLDRILGKY